MFSLNPTSPGPIDEYTFATSDLTSTPAHIRIRTGEVMAASPRRLVGGAGAFGGYTNASLLQQLDSSEAGQFFPTVTPKAAGVRPTRTPKSLHLFSSPAQQTDVLAGVYVPGFDEPEQSYPTSPAMSPIATTAPTPATVKRSLQGLGFSPARGTKRARQATMAGTSIPASPAYRKALRGNSTMALTESMPVPPPSNPHGLMTNRPLERAVSGPAVFAPPPPQANRVLSTNSVASSASTEILSPMMGFVPLPSASQPVSEMSLNWNMSYMPSVNSAPGSGTIAPSALLGHGLNAGVGSSGGFVTSPEMLQDEIIRALSASVSPVPQNAQILPSYQSQGLSSIQEIDTDAADFMDTFQYNNNNAPLPHTGAFPSVTYPPVPGSSYHPPGPHNGQNVQGWHPDFNFDFNQGAPPPAFGRTTSYAFGSSQAGPASFPIQRAVSMPFVPTMPSIASNPPDLHQGLFAGTINPTTFASSGSNEEIDALIRSMSQDQGLESSSGRSAPVTPSKKRTVHPPIGNRMKPGPKPKPKTPKSAKKKGKSASVTSPGPDSAGPSPMPMSIPEQLDVPLGARPPRSVVHAMSLSGEMLYAGPAHPLQPPTAPAGPGPATMAFMAAPRQPPVHGVHHPIPPTMPDDPPLTLDPPTRGMAAEHGVSGLPKDFIEKLYRTEFDDPVLKNKFYRCLIEGCTRTFPRKSAIVSHIQTHLDDKPFICECGCAFVRMHDLRRHTRIHSGAKPFACACGKAFARGDALMRHRQRDICAGGLNPGAPKKAKGKGSKAGTDSPPPQPPSMQMGSGPYNPNPMPQPQAYGNGGFMFMSAQHHVHAHGQ